MEKTPKFTPQQALEALTSVAEEAAGNPPGDSDFSGMDEVRAKQAVNGIMRLLNVASGLPEGEVMYPEVELPEVDSSS